MLPGVTFWASVSAEAPLEGEERSPRHLLPLAGEDTHPTATQAALGLALRPSPRPSLKALGFQTPGPELCTGSLEGTCCSQGPRMSPSLPPNPILKILLPNSSPSTPPRPSHTLTHTAPTDVQAPGCPWTGPRETLPPCRGCPWSPGCPLSSTSSAPTQGCRNCPAGASSQTVVRPTSSLGRTPCSCGGASWGSSRPVLALQYPGRPISKQNPPRPQDPPATAPLCLPPPLPPLDPQAGSSLLC